MGQGLGRYPEGIVARSEVELPLEIRVVNKLDVCFGE